MKDHVRVSLHEMKLQCANCGTTEDFAPGLVLALEEKLGTFRVAHAACLRPVFNPGDRVSYCGETAVVIENHGDSGTVEIGTGHVKERGKWYWEFQGEPVIIVKPEAV